MEVNDRLRELRELREAFVDAMVMEARNLEWRPGTMLDETPVTLAGLRQAVLEHDTFPNDVLRFRLPRENDYFVCRTTGDGNCLYTSVSAGMAMIDLRREIHKSGGWFRLGSKNPEHWHLRPDSTDRSHILRGYDLRLDAVEYFLRGYEDPELAERKTTLEAIASQVEPAAPGPADPPQAALPAKPPSDDALPDMDCDSIEANEGDREDESMEADFEVVSPMVRPRYDIDISDMLL